MNCMYILISVTLSCKGTYTYAVHIQLVAGDFLLFLIRSFVQCFSRPVEKFVMSLAKFWIKNRKKKRNLSKTRKRKLVPRATI